jgi:quinol monooxygenase YgiN
MSQHPILAFMRGKLRAHAGAFTIIADLEAAPGRGDAIAAAIASTQAILLTRQESGCVSYDVVRDADAPDRFVACECWRDLSALEHHLATPHFAAVGAALDGLLAGAPQVRVLRPISAHTAT